MVRRPLGLAHPRLRETTHSHFQDFTSAADAFAGVDACFYCLGKSVRQVSGEAEYRTITYDYAMAAARALRQGSPAAAFHFISGAGAALDSRFMWARVKAETERDLLSQFDAVCDRPASIDGMPSASQPFGYKVFRPIARVLLKPFRSLYASGDDIGLAMLRPPPTVFETASSKTQPSAIWPINAARRAIGRVRKRLRLRPADMSAWFIRSNGETAHNEPGTSRYVPGERPQFPDRQFNYHDECVRDGFARVGWPAAGDLRHPAWRSRANVAYGSMMKAHHVRFLEQFAGILPGDLVVLPGYQRRHEVHLGIAVPPRRSEFSRGGGGAYYYHFDISACEWFENAHRVDVKWAVGADGTVRWFDVPEIGGSWLHGFANITARSSRIEQLAAEAGLRVPAVT